MKKDMFSILLANTSASKTVIEGTEGGLPKWYINMVAMLVY